MNGCGQNAEYEVKDGACVPTERAKAYACGLRHLFDPVTFLCYAHAYEAGYKNLKNLHENAELAEWRRRVMG
jgi:hypothetical protein